MPMGGPTGGVRYIGSQSSFASGGRAFRVECGMTDDTKPLLFRSDWTAPIYR